MKSCCKFLKTPFYNQTANDVGKSRLDVCMFSISNPRSKTNDFRTLFYLLNRCMQTSVLIRYYDR